MRMSVAVKTLCLFMGLSMVAAQETTTVGRQMSSDYESVSAMLRDCPEENISFELYTGYVYSAPEDMLDSRPGTLMLTDCIEHCRKNETCISVNFETGLCVLFSSQPGSGKGELTKSTFPVFTIFLHKKCIAGAGPSCKKSWVFENVPYSELQGYVKKSEYVDGNTQCEQLCIDEKEFPCRSANYNTETGECGLSDMNRHTAVGTKAFQKNPYMEYLESNCVHDPVRMCEFQQMQGRILKTVDSVVQEVNSLEDCKALCLTAPFRCHSFDYGDTGDQVCRLSHHAVATLSHIDEPYLDIQESSTYELSSCYNVTIDCRSGDMVTRITTSKIFNGKIYAKGSPNTCVMDVQNSLDFELVMPYNDMDCGTRRENSSRYSNDVIIQHHDMIVTSSDLGLSVHCQYDLSNKSVSNNVNLNVTGSVQPSIEEETIVDSPNVIMRVADQSGQDLSSASVGDMLELRFEIVDMDSPYEIFVRQLVATDGTDETRITLLDGRGCPTEMGIMRPLIKADETGKILSASFDAFKFPSSDVVQFKALVTPCLPFCEPVSCDVMDFGGQMINTDSYGRKKRSTKLQDSTRNMIQDIVFLGAHHMDISVHSSPAVSRPKRETSMPNDLLVEQRITISDKFGFQAPKQKKATNNAKTSQTTFQGESVLSENVSGQCINSMGLILACALFLVAQVILVVIWTAIWQRRRHNKLDEPLSHTTTTESLRQLYDSGYPRRI